MVRKYEGHKDLMAMKHEGYEAHATTNLTKLVSYYPPLIPERTAMRF